MAGKGIIIKVHDNQAVIMTDQCEFKEITLKSRALAGDMVAYSDEDLKHYTRYSKIPALVASVLLCCLLAASLLYKPFPGGTYAFVTFDINPSFELSIDRDNLVTSARSLNKEGEFLLDQAKIINRPLDQAVSQIIRQNCQDGHLVADKTHNIAVSLYFPGDNDDLGFLDNLDALITKELNDNNVAAAIFYFQIDRETYDEALQYNVSPSRLVMWEAARECGLNYDLNGSLPWSDSRLTGIASGHACRSVRLQARHGMENPSGEPPGDQPGQGQPQDRKDRKMNHSSQDQNGQFAPGTGDDNSDQNGSKSTPSIEAGSTTDSPPHQNQGQRNNAPVDSGGQNSNSLGGSTNSGSSNGSNGSNRANGANDANGSSNSSSSGSSSGASSPGGSSSPGSSGDSSSGSTGESGGSGGSGGSGSGGSGGSGSGGSGGSGR